MKNIEIEKKNERIYDSFGNSQEMEKLNINIQTSLNFFSLWNS